MTSSIFCPSTPPCSLIQSRAISAPTVEDLPSAAAGPDCGAWKPILISAEALPANSRPAARAAATKLLCMIAPLGGRMDRHKHRPDQILTRDLPVAPEHEVVVVLQ